jgi:uncharacterized integral membrane protein
MQSEEPSNTQQHSPQSQEYAEGKRPDPEGIVSGLLQTAWQKHRALTAFSAVVAFILLMIIIQNPAKTTVDLLLWTVSLRQGVSLALLFLIGGMCGWVSRMLYHREHVEEH